jgi:hypothetical protein
MHRNTHASFEGCHWLLLPLQAIGLLSGSYTAGTLSEGGAPGPAIAGAWCNSMTCNWNAGGVGAVVCKSQAAEHQVCRSICVGMEMHWTCRPHQRLSICSSQTPAIAGPAGGKPVVAAARFAERMLHDVAAWSAAMPVFEHSFMGR